MSDDVKEPEAVTRARQHVAAIDEADRLGIDHADAPDYQQFLRDILGHIDALTEYALAAEREREAMLGTIYNVEAMAAEIATLREQLADYHLTEGAWEAACVQAERERDELRQRVQVAEKAARTTIDDCRRQGVSLGRSLANYACKMERERADAAEHRAERMERVLAAAENLISYQGTANESRYYDALVAEVTMERLALAVDPTPTPEARDA